MPTGPQGQKRPADAIGLAVMIGKIATGEVSDDPAVVPTPGARRGLPGAVARKVALTPERRNEIAKAANAARWS